MKRGLTLGSLLTVIAVLAAVLMVPMAVFQYATKEATTITVAHKERILSSSNEGKYLIYTAEGETFEVTDTWFWWNFNSSDLYGSLKVGEKYKVKVNGWRFGLFSWYRNILTANPSK